MDLLEGWNEGRVWNVPYHPRGRTIQECAMKKNVLYIDSAKFTAIATEMGVKTKDNAGFTQWILGNGYHLYVAKTKTVGRVDFQYLPAEGLTGVKVLGAGEKFGRIVAQLDFDTTLGELAILANFRAMVEMGSSLATWERPKKVQPGTPVAASSDASSPKSDMTKEERVEAAKKRAELIKSVAKQHGVEVSAKAELA
jgi:hypothetical protein